MVVHASADLECSTPIFMRRFQHSNLAENMDKEYMTLVTLIVEDGVQDIISQFGESSYGKEKYSKSALFWIGYMYRYISYTRQQSTNFVMKLFNYKSMNNVYYSCHTQDPEWCIRSLLEINNLSENIFDNNWRLKQIIRKSMTSK